jgi:peptidoglycan/LPS O-acetylase OafA/YrhL
VPTIGAALIILFATEQTFVGKVLGSKPLVGCGLVSYSAYLWHQPLFAFEKLRGGGESTNALTGLLACVTFIFAYFSYKFKCVLTDFSILMKSPRTGKLS